MKKNPIRNLCLTMAFSICSSATHGEETAATAQPEISFADYPAEGISKSGQRLAPKIRTSFDRQYRTRIREAAKNPIDFAGHYVLSSFGCGTGCIQPFALDVRSGDVVWFPFTVCSVLETDVDVEPVTYRKDSRLLAVVGMLNEGDPGSYYFELKGKRFVRVK